MNYHRLSILYNKRELQLNWNIIYEYNNIKGDDILDNKKDISEKIFETASNLSKKGDYILKIGEYKINIRLLYKEIRKRKLDIGDIIYKGYRNNKVDVDEVIKICTEIKELEIKIEKIDKEIFKLKELLEEG